MIRQNGAQTAVVVSPFVGQMNQKVVDVYPGFGFEAGHCQPDACRPADRKLPPRYFADAGNSGVAFM